jgi:hypothetical protein
MYRPDTGENLYVCEYLLNEMDPDQRPYLGTFASPEFEYPIRYARVVHDIAAIWSGTPISENLHQVIAHVVSQGLDMVDTISNWAQTNKASDEAHGAKVSLVTDQDCANVSLFAGQARAEGDRWVAGPRELVIACRQGKITSTRSQAKRRKRNKKELTQGGDRVQPPPGINQGRQVQTASSQTN